MLFIIYFSFSIHALHRAYFISTLYNQEQEIVLELCQCPQSGLLHFYGTPLETLYLCGFPEPFLQVIHRIF